MYSLKTHHCFLSLYFAFHAIYVYLSQTRTFSSLSQHTHLLMNIHRTARLMSGGGLQGDNLAGMM